MLLIYCCCADAFSVLMLMLTLLLLLNLLLTAIDLVNADFTMDVAVADMAQCTMLILPWKRIPVKMGVLNLVHELLHSFGYSIQCTVYSVQCTV